MKAAYRYLGLTGAILAASILVFWLARTQSDDASISMPTRATTARRDASRTDSQGSEAAPLIASACPVAAGIDAPSALKRFLATLIGPVDVFGAVVDSNGVAVPSAIVRGEPDPGTPAVDFSGGCEVRTDETGRFRMRLPAGTERVALHARADDDSPGTATLRLLGPPKWGRLDSGTIILERRLGITGRIVDLEGRAVAGACVVPSRHGAFDDSSAITARSLPDGTFDLPCVESGAPTTVIVSHPDFGLAIGSVARCGGEPTTIVLAPSPVVHRHVHDEHGLPIAGARVEASSFELFEVPPALVEAMKCGFTDADGEYRLRLVPTEDLDLMATALGCSPARRRITLAEGGDEEIDFALHRVGTISGVVVDAVTGKPIEGATVSQAPAPTDRGGRFRATLPDRESEWARDATEFPLEASKPGYARSATTVSFDDLGREARIELRPAATIRGLVLDPDGHPLESAMITVSETHDWHHAATGGDGTFVIDTLRADRYTDFWVSHPSYPRRMLPGFELREGESREFTCVLGTGRSARGRVVARGLGAPIANASVVAWRWVDKWFSDVGVYTNARGEFSLRGLFDAPTWIVVTADGFAPSAIPVELPPEPATLSEVEVTLGSGVVVEGDVLDETGAPRARTWVHVRSELPAPLDQFFGSRAITADARGRFRIADVPEAPLQLGARAVDMQTHDFRVAADRRLEPPFDPVSLVLVPTPWPLPRR